MEEGQPVLTVADNGPGIPNEELAYIFDAFYRGTHSRQEAGYGLGLTIVKLVVDLHGWSIAAQNRQPSDGHGLVVSIRMKASA